MQAFNAYTVINYKKGSEKRARWQKIGAAFAHKDNEGFDLVLFAVPVDGRVVLRKPMSKEAIEATAAMDYDDEDAKAWIDGQLAT